MGQRLGWWAVVLLDAVALGVFWAAMRKADSYLPELGGRGNASAIHHFNGLAGLSFWLLVGLWVVSVVFYWVKSSVQRSSNPSSRGTVPLPQRLALTLPVIGLICIYALQLSHFV
jgi:hypothetical protein